MKKFVILVISCLMFTGSQGCSKPRPEGLPDLTPCTIILDQDGNPASGVNVSFEATGSTDTGGFPIYGTTDSTGTLIMKTREIYDGIPAGEYIVTLSKMEAEGDPVTSPGKVKLYSMVDKIYTDKSTSPLKLTVGSEPVKQTWNIGKPQRADIKNIRRSL